MSRCRWHLALDNWRVATDPERSLPSSSSWLRAMLLDDGCPQTPCLMVVVGAGVVDRRLHHDELGNRVDANVLPLVSDQRELAAVARKEPQQIAIAEQLCGSSGQ